MALALALTLSLSLSLSLPLSLHLSLLSYFSNEQFTVAEVLEFDTAVGTPLLGPWNVPPYYKLTPKVPTYGTVRYYNKSSTTQYGTVWYGTVRYKE